MNRKERRRQKKFTPQSSSSNNELLEAIQHHNQKAYENAEKIYLRVISKDRTNYQGLRHLGILYHDTRQHDKAIKYLDNAINLQPSIPDAYNNLGLVYFINDEIDVARSLFEKSFNLNNSYIPAVNNLTRVYFKMSDREKCMKAALHALKLAPNGYICKLNHALALSINGKIDEGIQLLENLKHENKTDDLYNQLALMYEVSGKIEKSNEYLLESFKLNQNNYAMLAKLLENDVLDEKKLNYKIEDIYNKNDFMNLKEKHHLARCLYINYNKKKNFSLAGKYLVESNKSRDEILKYDIDNDEYFIERLISSFNKKILNNPDKKNLKNTSPTPIFILGMPRSGTTLTEQILASHSKVHGGGELDYVRSSLEIERIYDLDNKEADNTIAKLLDYDTDKWSEIGDKYIEKIKMLNNNNEDYVTDKMPHNFMLCGIINKMLPEAKIVFCYRDPMNNCFSLYKNTFGTSGHGYSYDQTKLSKHYNLHVKLMKHWKDVLGDKIFLLKNESLIDDQKGVTAKLLKHCGLEWEDQCLEFYKTQRDVRTISIRQVRNPINKKSLGLWKNYADSLSEMQKSLKEFS
ncbi:sulfotransferase [Pelagibacteraceae bacterium]|nr:sulfotransferase [Pelagibacteraceae bacterium]